MDGNKRTNELATKESQTHFDGPQPALGISQAAGYIKTAENLKLSKLSKFGNRRRPLWKHLQTMGIYGNIFKRWGSIMKAQYADCVVKKSVPRSSVEAHQLGITSS